MFEDEPVSRAALTDVARALPSLHHIAQFIIANQYPHPQFLSGLLGSEVQSPDGANGATVVERDTATGQGAQSDLALTLFRACTAATMTTALGTFTGTELALFDPYDTGLVPRPDADKDILRLFGWALGFMFTHNIPTGTPSLSPAIFATLLGIHVPDFTDALAGLRSGLSGLSGLSGRSDLADLDRASVLKLPTDLSCNVELALTFIGPTASYATSEQLAAISAQFKELVGSDIVTGATFNDLVRIAQPLFRTLLGDAIEAIATGFRASIVGSSTSVPAVRETNVIRSCAAIFGTPCDPGRGEDTFATDSDLAHIGAFTAGACVVDLAEMRRRTRYAGFGEGPSSAHPAVAAFWAALDLLDPKDLEKFYEYWTSAPPPRSGLAASVEYRITGKDDASRHSISAHTCFNGIDISTVMHSVEAMSTCIKNTIEHDGCSRSMHH